LMHDITSKVGHQVESHCHVALECFFVIISYYPVCIFINQSHISKVSQT
jgi:hypothetical protein